MTTTIIKKPALRYQLLRLAQSVLLVDPRMQEQEQEFKEQATGLFNEFLTQREVKNRDIIKGMELFVNRKVADIPNADGRYSAEKYLTALFGEHCGLNANWSVMAWPINVNADKGIFIIDNDAEDDVYLVLERYYSEELWNTEQEFNTLFTGTAQQCIDFVNDNNLKP